MGTRDRLGDTAVRAVTAAYGRDGYDVASPCVDRCHGIGFELQEDRIRSAGLTRAGDVEAGCASERSGRAGVERGDRDGRDVSLVAGRADHVRANANGVACTKDIVEQDDPPTLTRSDPVDRRGFRRDVAGPAGLCLRDRVTTPEARGRVPPTARPRDGHGGSLHQ
jgi:hypothetical protein